MNGLRARSTIGFLTQPRQTGGRHTTDFPELLGRPGLFFVLPLVLSILAVSGQWSESDFGPGLLPAGLASMAGILALWMPAAAGPCFERVGGRFGARRRFAEPKPNPGGVAEQIDPLAVGDPQKHFHAVDGEALLPRERAKLRRVEELGKVGGTKAARVFSFHG